MSIPLTITPTPPALNHEWGQTPTLCKKQDKSQKHKNKNRTQCCFFNQRSCNFIWSHAGSCFPTHSFSMMSDFFFFLREKNLPNPVYSDLPKTLELLESLRQTHKDGNKEAIMLQITCVCYGFFFFCLQIYTQILLVVSNQLNHFKYASFFQELVFV